MMLPFAVACGNVNNGDTTTPDTTLSEVEELTEKILIAENGKAIYKLIRSEFATSGFYSGYNDFLSKLKETTGAAFSGGDDFLRKGGISLLRLKYFLVRQTDRNVKNFILR